MNVLLIGGARPNFVKISALYHEFKKRASLKMSMVHTGQHFDNNMSQVFFEELALPDPDVNLAVSGGTHTTQTSRIMLELERVLPRFDPDFIIVVGDVNSTLAASLVAAKSGISIAHVESGLRSGDRSMPEEINRIVVDHLADLLFVSEQSGMDNLKREGISKGKSYFVGNVMIDTLVNNSQKISKSRVLNRMELTQRDYVLLTLHRPSNSDDAEVLKQIFSALKEISRDSTIVFPVHPRTKSRMDEFGIMDEIKDKPGFIQCSPLGYIDFLNLQSNARIVLTDSGGVQEETTFLGIPCLTVRENTERPVTIEFGTNKLVGMSRGAIVRAYEESKDHSYEAKAPPLWDGKASSRIADVLENFGG
jgi:UDP-N-acetylglucosamine 2-epimerase (non-hydrolysing)